MSWLEMRFGTTLRIARDGDYFLSCFADSTMAFSVGISFQSGAELSSQARSGGRRDLPEYERIVG
jgi:hypothetical protein